MIRFNPHLKARIIILTSHWTTGGFSLEIHVMDECTRHDSSCVTEIIARGLERVQEICQRRGRGVPTRLVVCGDNTVRELKNQINLTYISALVSKRKMRLSALAFLRKSHTHDRLDQIFGILARRIASEDRLMDPSDTIRIITTELSRPGLRSWIGNSTELHVQKLDAVRDWKTHLQGFGISLSGGLLEDSTGNHFFLMMQRKGWGTQIHAYIIPITTIFLK